MLVKLLNKLFFPSFRMIVAYKVMRYLWKRRMRNV
jgi:hypothetical protein